MRREKQRKEGTQTRISRQREKKRNGVRRDTQLKLKNKTEAFLGTPPLQKKKSSTKTLSPAIKEFHLPTGDAPAQTARSQSLRELRRDEVDFANVLPSILSNTFISGKKDNLSRAWGSWRAGNSEGRKWLERKIQKQV